LKSFKKLSTMYKIVSQLLSPQTKYVCESLQICHSEQQMVTIWEKDGVICSLSSSEYVKEVILMSHDPEMAFQLSGNVKPWPFSK
jgi:hypothetical protein